MKDCCQNSCKSMEMRGRYKKKETNEGEVRVKEKKKGQEEKVGQLTEIRRASKERDGIGVGGQ